MAGFGGYGAARQAQGQGGMRGTQSGGCVGLLPVGPNSGMMQNMGMGIMMQNQGMGMMQNQRMGMQQHQMGMHVQQGFGQPMAEEQLVVPSGALLLRLGFDSSMVAAGMHNTGPAIVFDKNVEAHNNAPWILAGFDEQKECSVIDDASFDKAAFARFPEILYAVKKAGGEQMHYAIAELDGYWGVGLGALKKGRDNAARLALAVALNGSGKSAASTLVRATYPDFAQFLMGQGNSQAESGGKLPVMAHIMIGAESQLCAEGLARGAVAVKHGGKYDKQAFVNAHFMLEALVGDMATVEFQDDESGTLFPDVCHALLAAGFEESPIPICIAANTKLGVWAVGCAYSLKFRETSAKLALALAIAKKTGGGGQVTAQFPEFEPMCAVLNIPGAAAPAGSAPVGRMSAPGGNAATGSQARQAGVIQIPPDSPFVVQEGLSPQAPAIMHGGKSSKANFSNASYILGEFRGEGEESGVELHDDSECDVFPDVHVALKAAGFEPDASICIAAHAGLGSWGVGCGYGKKFREQAAKMALSVALAANTGKIEELSTKYPEFYGFCEAAGCVTGIATHVAKKARFG